MSAWLTAHESRASTLAREGGTDGEQDALRMKLQKFGSLGLPKRALRDLLFEPASI
jgi:hypothetical protein